MKIEQILNDAKIVKEIPTYEKDNQPVQIEISSAEDSENSGNESMISNGAYWEPHDPLFASIIRVS